jgi:hypothetical protein
MGQGCSRSQVAVATAAGLVGMGWFQACVAAAEGVERPLCIASGLGCTPPSIPTPMTHTWPSEEDPVTAPDHPQRGLPSSTYHTRLMFHLQSSTLPALAT